MRRGQASVTAMFVAFARAVATHDDDLSRACQDETAERIVPRPFRTLLELAASTPSPARTYAALRTVSLGLVDHLALRTAEIDAAVRGAVARGARQLVVLGAGLDSRAYRMDALAPCVVFEVDHPSTQELKRRKVRGLAVRAREVRYAACDFERVSLEQALASVGFDPNVATVWIWEGVTMYLEAAAIAGTLDTVARFSAKGSTLITSYLTPDVTTSRSLVGRMGLEGLRYLSEPVRSKATCEQMAAALASRGFRVLRDVLPGAVAAEHGASPARLALAMPSERVVVATNAPDA